MRAVAAHLIQSGKPDRSSDLLKLYFANSVVVGILAVLAPKHGKEIPMSLCQNIISTPLHGNKIPTKHSWELYTIYNPANRTAHSLGQEGNRIERRCQG